MKINTEKHFDIKKAKTIFSEEYKFINEVFSRSALPVHDVPIDDDLFTNNTNKTSSTFGKPRAKNVEELQSRLEQLKGARGLEYKEKMQKKKLKNQLKKKDKQEKRRQLKKMVMAERNASNKQKIQPENDAPKVPKTKPVFNSEGHMVFSKFDFKELSTKKSPKVEKNPKKLLEKLKEKKQKFKELEQAGEKEKVAEMKEKEAWKAALSKAKGEKVKDDPELLKQTIKREEKRKERSAKKWKARMDSVQNDKQNRQLKRQENIAIRKKQKKTNKLKKAAKKGRVIPGF